MHLKIYSATWHIFSQPQCVKISQGVVSKWCFQAGGNWKGKKYGSRAHSLCGGIHEMGCVFKTLWPRQDGRRFCRRHFQLHFIQWKCLNFKWNFIEICSLGSSWQYGSMVSDNGLAPNRRQAIIWSNADPIHWHIYAALVGDELSIIWSLILSAFNLQESGFFRSASLNPGRTWRRQLAPFWYKISSLSQNEFWVIIMLQGMISC